MPAGHGLRSRTRDLFARGFRKKGMPHKFYHGRTGQVWNVTKRAIGVEMNKQVGNRIIKKRIHVRVEHVMPSRCTEEFKQRVKKNDVLKAEAKAKGWILSQKSCFRLLQVCVTITNVTEYLANVPRHNAVVDVHVSLHENEMHPYRLLLIV
ncbi:unnamed protein product [Lactuca virosa]|uniref:60S ribosomal protein L21 n=1 Tax=Lactuca virosa TaxID=75947 RepID=A0AAU9NUU6_9ASTR|nr:unnamed protein product [Lactuca virosa]